MYKQYKPYQAFLVVADCLLILVIFQFVVESRPFLPGRLVSSEYVSHEPLLYVFLAFLWLTMGAISGIYELSRLPFFSKQLGRFTSTYCVAILAFVGILYFASREMSRVTVIYFAMTNYFALLLLRYALTLVLKRGHGLSHPIKVLIVGASETGMRLAGVIEAFQGKIYNVIGFVDDIDPCFIPPSLNIIGGKKDLVRLVEEKDVQLVMIAVSEGRMEEIDELLTELYPLPVRIYLVPDLLKITILHSEVDTVGDITVIGIREPVIQGLQWVAKRTLDVLVSALVLILCSPLMLIIAIAIKLDSRGPVIFKAQRVGANGNLFRMLKFRTMVADAEKLQIKVMRVNEDGQTVYKSKDDPRITRIGRFLRRTSLDELPQLINVLIGEMSLVGPRPEQPFITKNYEGWQWLRLSVPPGITGLWQISGRSDLPMHLNTRLDIHYARNYSLLLDLKILFRTAFVVLQGRGAY
jgi:exopolysaccharide biosynthesis polyprenyl glycosylphosphotransferase